MGDNESSPGKAKVGPELCLVRQLCGSRAGGGEDDGLKCYSPNKGTGKIREGTDTKDMEANPHTTWRWGGVQGVHGNPESPISAGKAQGRLAKGTKGVLWIRVCEESVSIYELCGGKMDL